MSDRPDRGLVDTNVIVHLPNIKPSALPTQLAISSITLAELSAAPLTTDDRAEQAMRIRRLQGVEAAFSPLPFDAEAARNYASVYAAVLQAGRQPRRRFAHLLIACIAMSNRLPLFTINPRDFLGLDHLVDVVPVERPEDIAAPPR